MKAINNPSYKKGWVGGSGLCVWQPETELGMPAHPAETHLDNQSLLTMDLMENIDGIRKPTKMCVSYKEMALMREEGTTTLGVSISYPKQRSHSIFLGEV